MEKANSRDAMMTAVSDRQALKRRGLTNLLRHEAVKMPILHAKDLQATMKESSNDVMIAASAHRVLKKPDLTNLLHRVVTKTHAAADDPLISKKTEQTNHSSQGVIKIPSLQGKNRSVVVITIADQQNAEVDLPVLKKIDLKNLLVVTRIHLLHAGDHQIQETEQINQKDVLPDFAKIIPTSQESIKTIQKIQTQDRIATKLKAVVVQVYVNLSHPKKELHHEQERAKVLKRKKIQRNRFLPRVMNRLSHPKKSV
jgi:hypothetical protein